MRGILRVYESQPPFSEFNYEAKKFEILRLVGRKFEAPAKVSRSMKGST
jgi:hypothetical protein